MTKNDEDGNINGFEKNNTIMRCICVVF